MEATDLVSDDSLGGTKTRIMEGVPQYDEEQRVANRVCIQNVSDK